MASKLHPMDRIVVVNLFVLLVPLIVVVAASPLMLLQPDNESAVSHDSVIKYLMEYDYLPKSDIETGALRTEEQFRDAVKNLQQFANIPVTGTVDSKTLKLMLTPRCGVGDNAHGNAFSADNLQHKRRKKRYVLQGAKWNKTELTWSLVNQSMPDAGMVRLTLTNALKVWEKSSKLNFREVYSDQADIQVLFTKKNHGDGYNFDGPGQVLAHAFYPGEGRGGDAHFDDEEVWTVLGKESEEGTNLMDVAVHEFGHSLGLGHSSDQRAIMFPWYQGFNFQDNIPDDDRIAIQELYGSRTKTWTPFKNRGYKPRQTTPTTSTTTTTTTTTTRRPKYYYPDSRYPAYRPVTRYYRPQHATPTTTTTTTSTTTTTPYSPVYHTPTRSHHMKPKKLKPDSCNTVYDAISMIRNELFIFRGQFLWRIGEQGLYAGFPIETRRMWFALPQTYAKIDAVYENRQQKIIFFIGQLFYVFDSITLDAGYPKPLTALGLPASIRHIDAAFVWGHNNMTYLFSGTLYWRLDENSGTVELDYPRDMSIWGGVGYNIDAAFQYTDRKTYFFKNYGYWEFNDDRMAVAHRKPKLSARRWMKCPRRMNEVDEDQSWSALLVSDQNDTSTESSSTGQLYENHIYCQIILPLIMTFATLFYHN